MPKIERKKITENMRTDALRRVDGKLKPSVLKDAEVSGFALHVTRQRSFWALSYQPRGLNPATSKRWAFCENTCCPRSIPPGSRFRPCFSIRPPNPPTAQS